MPLRKDTQVRYAGRKALLNSIMRKYELDKPKQREDGLSAEKKDMAPAGRESRPLPGTWDCPAPPSGGL